MEAGGKPLIITKMPHPKILVVDDQLLSTRLLERRLVRSDMKVYSASNGEEGLRIAKEVLPDIILLDIVMPGMDGIAVCRELKRNDKLRDIPVIFITARTETRDKIEGFDVGATDFLVKPLNLEEAHARIKTQLRIIEEHQANIKLTRQLEESRRQSSLMHLTEGIAHNLNNLLGVMVGYLSLLKRNTDDPEKILSNCESMDSAIKRMTRIVQQLTVIGQFTSLKTESVRLRNLMDSATKRFQRTAATDCPVNLDLQVPEDFSFYTNVKLMGVCLERLYSNALESHEGKDPSIEVVVRVAANNYLEITVMDRGKGIDPDIRDSVFEPFVTSSSVIGRGMGLTIARHSVTCLNGTIEALDREGGGTILKIRLPLDNPQPEADA